MGLFDINLVSETQKKQSKKPALTHSLATEWVGAVVENFDSHRHDVTPLDKPCEN